MADDPNSRPGLPNKILMRRKHNYPMVTPENCDEEWMLPRPALSELLTVLSKTRGLKQAPGHPKEASRSSKRPQEAPRGLRQEAPGSPKKTHEAARWLQPWPQLGRSLAVAGQLPGRCLAVAWPRHGHSLATAWPQPGRSMAAAWPLPGRSPAAAWPLPGRCLAAVWPQPGRCLAAACPQTAGRPCGRFCSACTPPLAPATHSCAPGHLRAKPAA